MASETSSSAFEQALADFRDGLKRDGLKKKDDELFRHVTRDSLLTHLEDVQNEQHTKRRGRNLARLQPMIEAMDQLGKVIEVFVNAQIFVAYVWIAGAYSGAFNDLLDMYEKIGDSFRLLTQSEQLFRTDSHMLRLLILMYKDIFEFHRLAIKYFRQPLLKQLFDATWKTYKSRFDPIINRIQDHGDLIHRQATLSHIRQFQQDRADREAERDQRKESEQNQRLRVLYDWLHSPSVQNDQDHFSKIRQEYPGTGRWLLDVPVFKEWFDPKFHSIPALLWITGMPGAGKTILASLVVEAAQALPSPPTVLFFYCKNGDKERDNFDSIGRTFLVRLLSENKDILLPYYYKHFSTSTETTLRTQSLIEDLLRTSIMNCPNVYIILDGIDECDRKERTRITAFFRGLVEISSNSQPDRTRCLFVSQHDGIAKQDFLGVTMLKIESKHNSADIETFCKRSARAIPKDFNLADTERLPIAKKVSSRANGMFLLAKLICGNLINQPSREDLDLELEDNNLPQELVEAYTRIITRILIKAPTRNKEASQKLLTWLVCAKRPMKWHEIQAAKSIHLETQTVDLEQYRFRVASKDLCGSLVEDGQDGTVELVHSTAKSFLLSEKHVKQRLGELHMATLCLSYWNMPGLSGHESDEQLKARVPSGYFAFLDYSISNWIYHFWEGLKDDVTKQEEVLQDLSECLGPFLDLHLRRSKTTKKFQISQSTTQRLEPFKEVEFYSDLHKVVTTVRKQLKYDGEMQSSEVLLDLIDIALNIRDVLEESYVLDYGDERRAEFERIYGKRIFKCTKLSCHAFHDGFTTATERKLHLDKHDRPFRCTVSGCPQEYIGFSTNEDLERHTAKTHAAQCDEEGTFPNDTEISATQIPAVKDQEVALDKIQGTAVSQRQDGGRHETQPQLGKKEKRTEFPCQSCSKVFRRKYNLQSHMVSHGSLRPYSCEHCTLSFARQSDLVRHEKSHGPREFICGGLLQTGVAWGCGKAFARADTLKAHHDTEFGKRCKQPFLQQQVDEAVQIDSGAMGQ
ncbi:hypothetical protein G7054_g3664 [Neopestalotiopsis clavispora]|nr:hypothetical protein G7054_g3664 [Neopestalotiopsis clavispora]